MGLSEDPELQLLLFGLFLAMYLVTMLGNLLIILVIILDSHLHTPMYFFLSNLSLVDIFFISTTIPKMIVGISMHSRVISYAGCLTQMTFFLLFVCMDDMILTVMAYDRFVAICHPLYYTVIMNPQVCVILILLSFSLHNLIALQVTCFKDVEIANFFCHPSQLLNLACTDTLISNIVIYFIGVILGIFPVLGIIFSYCKIFFSILKIPSSSGKFKAFSTCGSHLLVVCLFYGTGIGVYLGSAVSHSPRNLSRSSGNNVVASLMYTVVTPMLNPFIYSLRNQDIISSLKRLHFCVIQ
ncbi:Olfactory receptor 7E24 [Lemmus lemmus]